ncbi:hypothetical protein PPYR_10282 [Photinus pyralis]|uniref:Uncharacterized protein n=1 Tax=Photinus pyralis TaxID=7054 RepID=A0A1Y1KN97_PHOPY|nr:protein phosphatase 1 regulatory inhibitor subunit 16B isoform X1 [Photinus pyralis]KAB0796221.1 hypothetical protein PPYR_10282 [Photinus pyralis]
MDHSDLIQEMPQIEQLPTQDRLALARRRRAHQLKIWIQKEKEYHRKAVKAYKSAKPNIQFRDSVVLLEAAARNDIDEVRNLLVREVSPDSCNEDGLTALHQCCIDDNEAMLLLLLEYGANVNAEDSEKWTPLHAAATCGHLRLVSILIAHGANLLAVNADGNMPYDICEDEAALDYIEGEMANRGVTQQLIDDTRALTEKQMLIDLQKVAVAGGDLEKYDSQGATPLHIASANGYTSVVEFLLDHNVHTDVRDRDDWQPAHAAACWGHLEVLEILAQYGADLNAKNKNEETPADICEDPELKDRILQLRTEQENKRLAENKRQRVRRSQSNTRAQSVRRTSLRDKGLTARRDAVEEARLRMQAENKKGIDNIDSIVQNTKFNDIGRGEGYENGNALAVAVLESRKGPEGKDNDSLENGELIDTKNETTYTTDVNGKVTVVHVVVTINGNGTLADLKKQRMQIRNSSSDVNSLTSPVSGLPDNESIPTSSSNDIHRFTGHTDEIVGYSKSKRCCVIQ